MCHLEKAPEGIGWAKLSLSRAKPSLCKVSLGTSCQAHPRQTLQSQTGLTLDCIYAILMLLRLGVSIRLRAGRAQ